MSDIGTEKGLTGGPALSVVIPCFNEADGIAALVNRVSAACNKATKGDFDIVLVDDGSTDLTWHHIQTEAASRPAVRGVSLSRNFGQQAALSAGLAHARGARILILDADLQDPPEILTDMMAAMDAGADVVYGQRRKRAGETLIKRFTSALFYRTLNGLTETDIPRNTGDFRLISRRVLDTVNIMPENGRFVRGMISWVGFRQVALAYDREARATGDSKWSYAQLTNLAVEAITSFSTRPLRLASYMGFAFGIFGFALLSYTIFSWVAGIAVDGWTSLMGVVLILGSAQLIVLGVIGEYLGRLYMESKRRPLYVVDRTTEDDAAPLP